MIGWTAVAAIAGTMLAGSAPPASERVIRAGETAPTSVNGVPGTILIDPGAPSLGMLGADYAARAGLKAGPFRISWGIGPIVVPASTAIARIDLGAGPEKKRIGWSERPYVTGYDGAIGPGGLRDDVVRFVLRAPRPGERESVLPMADGGGLFGGTVGLFATVMLDGAPLRVRFDLRRQRSMTSAGTALTLARVHGGTLGDDRSRIDIAFGVERPVRTMALAQPLMIGTLAVARVAVRTTDYGNAEGIAAAAAAAPDPDEIVVTAKGKRDRRQDRITLGADVLSACSSIVFDKRRKQVRLTCT